MYNLFHLALYPFFDIHIIFNYLFALNWKTYKGARLNETWEIFFLFHDNNKNSKYNTILSTIFEIKTGCANKNINMIFSWFFIMFLDLSIYFLLAENITHHNFLYFAYAKRRAMILGIFFI